MEFAVIKGDLEMLLYLHTNRRKGYPGPCAVVRNALTKYEWEVFEWLYELYPDQVSVNAVRSQVPPQTSYLDLLVAMRDCRP
uniref:Uncharacterized protein n=1 Tax=Globisporangium ultimum (strain ATCC 200006 / CBS 805.95 / DAOM BR144) TaxID=431595 RepID=K3WNV5_GLOUD